ncbi:TIGR03086 family metal-binding protein [Nocardia huaxiensis]|uniref:TIGR03086 family metal-binding protein n=1 Tax=Nocardia huaxiensis TaxID=2755382 RepID=UPI001E63F007|nr:TIGR03086 family metal-binding protein [Nocardia huaxiensis]UFS97333.1 TIGR03086 family metal-binding protein [Nocardia huaxiensis]
MTTESTTSKNFESLIAGIDLIDLHARVVETSVEVASHVTPADLTQPTPCAGWTLDDLLAHMIAQHYGFAAAARGVGDRERWHPRPLGPDPAADYRAAAEHVLTAFAEPDVLDRNFPLPEFTTAFEFPGAQAVTFHFIDYVVHSWDVARTLGATVTFDDEILKLALPVARFVPDDKSRTVPGAAFAPSVAWSGDSTLDAVLALLGRCPDWRPAHPETSVR